MSKEYNCFQCSTKTTLDGMRYIEDSNDIIDLKQKNGICLSCAETKKLDLTKMPESIHLTLIQPLAETSTPYTCFQCDTKTNFDGMRYIEDSDYDSQLIINKGICHACAQTGILDLEKLSESINLVMMHQDTHIYHEFINNLKDKYGLASHVRNHKTIKNKVILHYRCTPTGEYGNAFWTWFRKNGLSNCNDSKYWTTLEVEAPKFCSCCQ